MDDKEKYYVISNSDGDTHVYEYDKNTLEEALNTENSEFEHGVYIEKVEEHDTNYWGDGFLIIKGKIIIPKTKEIVVRREIE